MTEFAINASTTTAKPRDAATVLVLRELAGRVEVLMTLRHSNLAFMGGMWVFPGGSLAAADSAAVAAGVVSADATSRCAQLHELDGTALARERCLALTVAACRETFEETGVLLAHHADGTACAGERLAELQTQRAAVIEKPEHFAHVLADERLLLDVAQLAYWAHWITPSSGPRRFDTRFFVVAVPADQTAQIDAVEAVEHRWMTPGEFADAGRKRTLPISQPTLYNLEDLDASLRTHGSLAAFIADAAKRCVLPVMPKMFREGNRTTIVMPWDPEYATTVGDGVPASVQYPAEVRAKASRFLFER